ncbi:RDD family protein [Paenibacillus macerans]|uniref:RDD family protein n=2 Tax=Paenibacillus macerans TaxID=44252 RepID=UPI0022E44DF7|nr:RDD family protein [Paenibacillus macerans]
MYMYDVLWRRYGAWAVDRLIVSIGALLISFIWISPREFFSESADTPTLGIPMLITFVCQWLYYTILESSKYQATLGKRLVGVVVVDRNHRRLSYGQANARFWGKLLSALTWGIGYLMAIFMEKKQALHDRIAGTYVVDKTLLRAREMQGDADTEFSRLHQANRADRSTGFNWPD